MDIDISIYRELYRCIKIFFFFLKTFVNFFPVQITSNMLLKLSNYFLPPLKSTEHQCHYTFFNLLVLSGLCSLFDLPRRGLVRTIPPLFVIWLLSGPCHLFNHPLWGLVLTLLPLWPSLAAPIFVGLVWTLSSLWLSTLESSLDSSLDSYCLNLPFCSFSFVHLISDTFF